MAAAMVEVEAMAEVAIMVEVVEETMEATCRVFICLSVLCSLHIQNFRTVQIESEAFLVAMNRGWWQLRWQWRWRWQLWWWKQ